MLAVERPVPNEADIDKEIMKNLAKQEVELPSSINQESYFSTKQ